MFGAVNLCRQIEGYDGLLQVLAVEDHAWADTDTDTHTHALSASNMLSVGAVQLCRQIDWLTALLQLCAGADPVDTLLHLMHGNQGTIYANINGLQTDRQTGKLSTAPLVSCPVTHNSRSMLSLLNLLHSLTHDMMTLAGLQSTLMFNQSIKFNQLQGSTD